MVSVWAKNFVREAVLVPALLCAALIRPSLVSVVYVILALLGPLFPSIKASYAVPSSTKGYVILILLVSLLAAISQFTYQIYESITGSDIDDYTAACNSSGFDFWMRQVGLLRVKPDAGLDAVRVVAPEILALLSSALTAVLCLAFAHRPPPSANTAPHSVYVQPVRPMPSPLATPSKSVKFVAAFVVALKRLGDVAIILFVGLVGVIQPSILNAVHFLAFLFVATWWASYTPLHRRTYNAIKRVLIFYTALHFLAVYVYQIPFVQYALPPGSFPARLIGFAAILRTECPHWWTLSLISSDYWTAFANAFLLLLLYYSLILQYRCSRDGLLRSLTYVGSAESSVHEELLVADDDDEPLESVPLQRITSAVIDREKIASIFRGANGTESVPSQGLISILSFCLYHGYMFGLLAMMAWGLIYHSVFGLVFLMAAFIFWVFKDTRSVSFASSPLILTYAEFLLMAQYVCSMDIANELPKSDFLEMIGFVLATDRISAFVTLLVKGILCLPLLVLLRLHLREKFYNSLSDRDRRKRLTYGTFSTSSQHPTSSQNAEQDPSVILNQSRGAQAVSCVSTALSKYWIFVVSLVLLLVSLQSPPLFYTLGYFVFFAVLLTLLQVSLGCLRRTLFLYWTLIVLYSSVVLLAVYCFQFPGFPKHWQEITGLDKEWTRDIGLINYKEEGDSSILFIRLIAPISFFFVAMLQLKFFHDPWCCMVAPPGRSAIVGDGPVDAQEPTSRYAKARAFFEIATEVLWRIAEVHVTKVVLLVLIIVAINDVCELNVMIPVFISIAVCLPSISRLLSALLCIYLSLFALARMLYQMHFITENATMYVYTDHSSCNLSGIEMVPTTEWLGFHKVFDIGNYIAGLIVSMVVLALQAVILYRQRHARMLRGEPIPPRGVIFADSGIAVWDKSFVDMLKFFLDFGFYKFGLEISMTMMVVVAWVRMDLIGTLTLLWLLVFACMSRSGCRRLWPLFLLYLAILFPLQYQLYVGLPPELCIDYPWSHWLSNPIQNDNLILWLDLASYRIHLNPYNTIADFFLLLMVACQEYAFRAENSNHPADDNKSVYSTGDYKLAVNNPRYDFIAHQRSLVDFLKVAVFNYGHWATLIMVLVAGLGGVSLFALGYIVLAFSMLWRGNNLYVMNKYQLTLKRWKLLLLYTVFTMFWKVALQVVGCAFVHLLRDADLCYVRQLLSIVCVSKDSDRENNYYFPGQLEFDNTCTVQKSETQIGFDTFAFAFLIFQMRILHSWYFQHCMLDYRSEAVLMNRGAVLTNQLIAKEMKEQNLQQSRKFDEIKQRTATIRKRYEEQQQYGAAGAFTPQTYGQAKRAGDYYMFEYDPNRDELVKPTESFVPEVTPGADKFDKLDPAQLLHAAVQRDLDLSGTLNAVETAEKIEDEEKRMIEAVSLHRDVPPASLREDEAPEHAEDESESERDEQEAHEGIGSKILVGLQFAWKLVLSALDMTAAFLNRRSRDHRYVAFVLTREKENLKQSLREWLTDVTQSLVGVREEFERKNLHCVSSEGDIERLETEALDAWQQRDVLARLITACGHCIAAHTDILCYLFAIIDHARSAGLLSMPLPLLVFFWGSLASPRPVKMFWIVMIGYTQLIVVIKFICQFGFFPWNETSATIKLANSPNYLPGILGVRKEAYYAFWDIVLLVALFFHRYMLRRMGLWNEANVSDTFTGETSVEEDSDALPYKTAADSQENTAETEAVVGDNVATNVEIDDVQKKRGLVANFFHQLFYPKFRYVRDLYPFMFLLDVLCFFVVSFGYSAFGYGGTGSVVKDISSNRVPITFVVMLMVISLMIVVDRALYLRKAVLCKLIYQFITVIFLHIWVFFVLPAITYQAAWLNKTAQFLYCVKCIYLLISAWQIRNGYPALCIGNLITHAYGLANMIFFKAFMAIPFIFEVRTAIDWTWTDTSMPLFDFFNMENFYATIYNLKCARTFEQNFPAPRGVPKGIVVKYLMGIPMIIILILVIWLPLLAFSLLNRIGMVLIPDNVQMTISVEGYPPLYSMEAQGIELTMLSQNEYDFIQNAFAEKFNSSDQNSILRARQAVAFINEYTLEDTLKVRFRPESELFWSISSDSLTAMKYELQEGTKTINAIVKLQFVRPRSGDSKEPTVHSSTITIPLRKGSQTRDSLIALLNGTDPSTNMTLKNSLPPYVIVPNEGEVKAPPTLLAVMHNSALFTRVDETYSDLAMKLKPNNNLTDMLWSVELEQDNATNSLTLPLEHVRYGSDHSLEYVQMVAFVDRVFPSFVTKYVQGGIIAMYLAVVLLVGRLIRGIVTNAPLDVIISEIPNPDYLLKICLDIYLVREAKDFVLEQDLFAKLIFLFRSPATLIKWTRFKVKSE
uniref:Piezo-type mechanosensitive ion channel component n=1 Tax=Parascaris univalens TaxID=6257 RepID=A0A915AVG5_PARUN